MSDILQLVQKRYTCKDYNPEKKLSGTDVENIKTILRNVPSSSNTQPARFLFVSSEELKEKIAKVSWESNYKRIVHASHLIIFCGINHFSGPGLDAIYAREEADGRFAHFNGELEYFKKQRKELYTSLPYSAQLAMIDQQVDIALGFFLLGVEGLGINATPMGGFTPGAVDELLNLPEKNLHSVFLVSVGHTAEKGDFNFGIAKSRLAPEDLFLTLD